MEDNKENVAAGRRTPPEAQRVKDRVRLRREAAAARRQRLAEKRLAAPAVAIDRRTAPVAAADRLAARRVCVREAERLAADVRCFSVVMPCVPADLMAVATAVDAADPSRRIPAPGEAHPDDPRYVADGPEIFCVARRDGKSGAIVQARTRFFNVRVRYAAAGARS